MGNKYLRPDESRVINVSQSVKDLYASCWAQEHESRPTMAEVVKSLAAMNLKDFDTRSRKRPYTSLKSLR